MEDKISKWGMYSFVHNLTKSTTLGLGTYLMLNISRIDTYISIIFSALSSFMFFVIINYIMNNDEKTDIISLNIRNFGTVIGTIINTVLNFGFFFLACVSLYNLSQFMENEYIPDTVSIYAKILIILPVIYIADKNIKVISKVSQMISIIIIAIFFISCIGLIFSVKLDNIFPIMVDGVKPILKSSFIYTVFSFAPLLLLLIIPKKRYEDKNFNYKKMFLPYVITSILIAIIILMVIFVFGINLTLIYRYPEYVVLREVSLFTIIERVEKILSLHFLFSVILYLVLTIYFMLESIGKVNKKIRNNKITKYLIGALMVVVANFMFKNSIEENFFIQNILTYVILFTIIVPVFISFIGELRYNFKKNKLKKLDV